VRNLYKVLGIASTADDLRIKSAFRRRALTTHPDLHPGNDEAEERFRELMQAYAVLRDAKARAAYDAHLARQRSQARRRFVQSAAVMVATFVLTTSSAVFLAGLQGINVHSETWQIATAWLTSVEVEPSTPGRILVRMYFARRECVEVPTLNSPNVPKAGSLVTPKGFMLYLLPQIGSASI